MGLVKPSKILKINRESCSIREVRAVKQGDMTLNIKLPSSGKICITRSLGGIGDILMMTPAIRQFKEDNPNVHLTVAVDQSGTWDNSYKEMLKNAPFIDEIIDARYVNKRAYQAVVNFTCPCIGFERKGVKVKNRIDYFAMTLGIREVRNPLPFYQVETKERLEAVNFLKSHKESNTVFVSIASRSNDEKRSWPKDKLVSFLKLSQQLHPNIKYLLFDFNNYLDNKSELKNVINCSSTTVRQMAALIGESAAFVGPDTGPMHIAGALKIPSIVLFGSIPPESRINYYPSHVAITAKGLSCLGCWYSDCPINFKCMKEIDPAEVLKKLYSLLFERKYNINFRSILNPIDGYGYSAEQMTLALDKITTIKFDSLIIEQQTLGEVNKKHEEICNRKGRATKIIDYLAVGDLLKITPEGAHKKYIYTTFESTKLPERWANLINCYDKCFVSCKEMKQIFIDNKVSIPIAVVPLGVDTSFWKYKERNLNGKVRFLMFANADWNNNRKNFSAGFTAFKAAYKDMPNSQLIIKISSGKVPEEVSSHPGVKVISERMSKARLKELIYDCHYLLFPSKGEGFGLPVREAMATGMPVIATNWAGLEEAMNVDGNFKLQYRMETATFPEGNLIKENNNSRDFGLWAAPLISSIKENLLRAYESFHDINITGKKLSDWIYANETYSITAERLLEETV